MPEETIASRTGKVPSPPLPTARDLLAVCFRQKRLLSYTFLSVLVLILAYGLLVPSYEAHMEVLLRRGRVDPVVTSGQSTPSQISRGEVTEEDLNSEVELLKDESLLRKVVEANALAADDHLSWIPFREKGHEVEVGRAVRRLGRRLKVEPVHKTNLIRITFDASDAALAKDVLESLAAFYVEKHKQVHRSGEEFPFFEQQVSASESNLQQAESRLVEFSQRHGVVSAAVERDLVLQRASDLDRQYQQVQIGISEKSRRVEVLRANLAQLPQRSIATIRTAENPQLMENLKGRLLSLELQRTELLSKYEPSYRLVQEVENQIEQARAAIVAEQLSPPRDETSEKDPDYAWTKSELEKAEVELSALQASQETVVAELGNTHRIAQQLGADAVYQQDLVRNARTAEETYLLYAKKGEEARISDALDDRGIINVAIAEAPVAPVLPKYSGWAILAVAVGAAGVLSTGLAFTIDYLDPALRTPDEVIMYLNAPVLASLPKEVA
jgi:uncharacterized protein involved in exopolysaccharide biosynthesis